MQKNNNIFKHPCLIKKNTPELRQKLEEIGYNYCPNGRGEWNIPIDELTYLKTTEDGYYIGVNGKWDDAAFDCGDNDGLFLAIAAIRDDTDKNQWFVLDTRLGSINYPDSLIPKGSLMKCLRDRWNIDLLEDGTPSPLSSRNIPAHKASLEELVTAFNTNPSK